MNIRQTLHSSIFFATLMISFFSNAASGAGTLIISSAVNTAAPDALNQFSTEIKESTKNEIDNLTAHTTKLIDGQNTASTSLQEGLTQNIMKISNSEATKNKEQVDKDAQDALDKKYAEICAKNLTFGGSCTKDGVDESISAINEYFNSDPASIPTLNELGSIKGVSSAFIRELLEQHKQCKITKSKNAANVSLDLASQATDKELRDSQDKASKNTNVGAATRDKVNQQKTSSMSANQLTALSNNELEKFNESVKLNYKSINGNISASYSLPGRVSESTAQILSTDYAYTTPAHYQIALDFKNNIINRESIPNATLGTGSVSKRSSFNSKHAALSIAEDSLLKMIARRTPPSISLTLSNLNKQKLSSSVREKELRSDSKSTINGYNNIIKNMEASNIPNFSSLALRYKLATEFNDRMTKFSSFSDEAKLKEIYKIQSAANQLTLTKIESMERIEMLLAALLASEINYRSQ